jgi:hypothetical protein
VIKCFFIVRGLWAYFRILLETGAFSFFLGPALRTY